MKTKNNITLTSVSRLEIASHTDLKVLASILHFFKLNFDTNFRQLQNETLICLRLLISVSWKSET